jgi:hypothetical protein
MLREVKEVKEVKKVKEKIAAHKLLADCPCFLRLLHFLYLINF